MLILRYKKNNDVSLTSFLKIPKVRMEFANTFRFERPVMLGEIKAVPQTQNYSLVGTAFDYLLRFHVERLNANSITRQWVAESAVELTKPEPEIYKKLRATIDVIKKVHDLFLKTGKLSDSVVSSSIILAKLDLIYRVGRLEPNLFDFEDADIMDLKNLISIADYSIFKSKSISALNPTFGDASSFVGGADADFVIDDTLIDVKTTKNLNFQRDHYDQLIGYYILSKIGGIDGVNNHKIKKIAIYFSRHGLLCTIPVSQIENNPKFDLFVEWFEEEAKHVFGSES